MSKMSKMSIERLPLLTAVLGSSGRNIAQETLARVSDGKSPKRGKVF